MFWIIALFNQIFATKECIKKLHTAMVEQVKRKLKPNTVLGKEPPDIATEELQLPRTTRCTLAQLRSGWSKHTNHYRNRIDPTVRDECPQCGTSPHDVLHLFSCPRCPTTLKPQDLWDRPIQAAEHLQLETNPE